MRITKLFFFILPISICISCNSSKQENQLETGTEDKFVKTTEVKVEKKVNPEFNQTLKSYEQLHQAYFDNDINQIKEVSQIVLNNLKSIQDQNVIKIISSSQKILSKIKQEDNLEASQDLMAAFSQNLLEALEKYYTNNDYARYYCPMLRKYWIQNITQSEKVMNPYASTTMPHCGSKR